MTQRYPLVQVAGQPQQLQAGDPMYGSIPYGRKNLVLNPNFDVWQRGTSFVAATNGAYFADRWLYANSGTAVFTVSQSTDVPTVAQSGILSNFSLKFATTTSQGAPTAAQLVQIVQRIEGTVWVGFAQRPLAVSFWVKGAKTGIHCVALRGGSTSSFVSEYTINVANTWEKKTFLVPASPSAGSWVYDIGIGLTLSFILLCGSNLQTTAGTWNSGNFVSTSNQVNECDTNGNNFLISQVQIEVGTIVTDFALIPFTEEYRRCQRYYCKTFPYATAPATGAGVTGALYCNDPGGCSKDWRFPVTMRTTPTVTTYNPVSANNNWRDTTTNADRGTPTQAAVSDSSIAIQNTGINSTNNFVHIDASAEL